MTTTILNDEREIKSIWFEGEGAGGYCVGQSVYQAEAQVKVTKIEAYGEPAQFCDVPWFAVYSDDTLIARIPAGQVTVHYT